MTPSGDDRVGVALVDPETLVVTWSNDYHLTLPGYPGGDTVGSRLTDHVPMGAQLGMPETIRRVAATGEPHREVMEILASGPRPAYRWWWAVYRLPSAEVLVVFALEGWQSER